MKTNTNEGGWWFGATRRMKAVWGLVAAAFVAGGLYSCGCKTVTQSAPLLLPAAVCKAIDGNPAAAGYVDLSAQVIERFSAGKDLSSESLAKALAGVSVPGVKPYEAQAIWGVVVMAYQAVGEQYVNTDERSTALKAALASVVGGLRNGLDACGPKKPPVSAAPTKSFMATSGPAPDIDSARLRSLAESIRLHLDASGRRP